MLFAVTNPDPETVRTVPLEDVQVADEVTFCVVPFAIVAVAVSCAACPILKEDVPVTAMADTEAVGFVGELLPHASTRAAMTARTTASASRRRLVTYLDVGGTSTAVQHKSSTQPRHARSRCHRR